MKLTSKGRYAVTALLDMAIHQHQQEGPMAISVLAERHHLSPTYLERLAGLLRSKGLLKSIRGPRGGYLLARPAHEITLADIIHAVDEKIDTTKCQGKANCHEGSTCLTHHLWDELNHQILHFLQKITLGALAQKPQVLNFAHQRPLSMPIQIVRANHV